MIETINKENISVFEITGTDALTFLNNQVVSELKQSMDIPRLTAICNPKGRIIFTLFIHKQGEVIFVAVDSSLSDNFLQYVNMRKFRMDLLINKSNFNLAINNQSKPVDSSAVSFTNDSNLPQLEMNNFWLFLFNSGLPWITHKTTENFIPQHLNLDQLNVIGFDKGCYPGQEIVARLHFLGKVKKRMQYIKYQSDQALEINTTCQIDEYDHPLEVCAPAIYHQDKWHSQAITST